MKTMTIPEFHAALKAQGATSRERLLFRCPICSTLQCMEDLINAGASPATVEKYIGFSCIGRFTNAGPFTKKSKPGAGCDWTLGGLFQLHKMEVVDESGKHHPHFEVAAPEEAAAHWASKG